MGSISQHTGRWVLDSAQEGISSLRYEPDATFTADQLGPEEVLVEIHAASLNYRELAICRVSRRLHSDSRFLCYLKLHIELVSDPEKRATHPVLFLSRLPLT